MRKPSEYIPAAMAKLRRSLIPDCSEVLRHGGRSAEVTRVGSVSKGGDSVTDSDVNENVRVLADAADFPDLSQGNVVALADTLRIVTSCNADISRKLLTVGLSSAMSECPAAYAGTRRVHGRVRNLDFTQTVLALETSGFDYGADVAAPSVIQTWVVCIAADLWPDETPPGISDEIRLSCQQDNAPVLLRVSSVVRHDGYWILRTRPREGQNG